MLSWALLAQILNGTDEPPRAPDLEGIVERVVGSRSPLAGMIKIKQLHANQYLIAAVEALAEHKPFFTGKISEQLVNAVLADRKGPNTCPKKIKN